VQSFSNSFLVGTESYDKFGSETDGQPVLDQQTQTFAELDDETGHDRLIEFDFGEVDAFATGALETRRRLSSMGWILCHPANLRGHEHDHHGANLLTLT